MPKSNGNNVSLYILDSTGASQSITGWGNSISLSWEAETPEVTTFGNINRERLPDGIQDWELSFDGFWGGDSGEIDEILGGILGGSTMIFLGPGGSDSGKTQYSACAILQSYEIGVELEEAVTFSATFVARSGSLTRGTWS